MKKNYNYAKLDGNTLIYAPNILYDGNVQIINATAEKYAENGEVAIIAKTAPVSESDVASLGVVTNKNLTVKGNGEFSGGVVLTGKGYEKRLTFSAIIEGLRAETETEISSKLF